MIREISKHVQALGQKLTAQNIYNFGQKILNTGCVMGHKVSSTLHKIEDIGQKALPTVSTITSMGGYPELSALTKAGGLKRITNLRDNINTVRHMVH